MHQEAEATRILLAKAEEEKGHLHLANFKGEKERKGNRLTKITLWEREKMGEDKNC